jgi:hypothetical protein
MENHSRTFPYRHRKSIVEENLPEKGKIFYGKTPLFEDFPGYP